MSQVALYGLDIIPGTNSGYGVTVAQIVETGIWAANGSGGPFKCPVYGWFRQVVAKRIRKNKVALLPQRSSKKPLLCLLHLPPPQMLHNKGRRSDGSGLAVLCRDKLICFHSLFLVKLHLLVDGEGIIIKIHTAPGEAQDFPLSQTREQGDYKQIFERIALYGVEKGGYLRIVQGIDFLPLCLWQLAEVTVSWIEGDIAVDDRLPESAMQDAMDVLYSFRGEGGCLVDDFSGFILLADLLSTCQQSVEISLDCVRVQLVQLDSCQIWFDVKSDIVFVDLDRPGFYARQVGICPNVQPFPQRHLARLPVGIVVHRGNSLGQLLADFFLRLSVNRLSDRLPGSWIVPDGEAGLPGAVRPLPDASGAGGGSGV